MATNITAKISCIKPLVGVIGEFNEPEDPTNPLSEEVKTSEIRRDSPVDFNLPTGEVLFIGHNNDRVEALSPARYNSLFFRHLAKTISGREAVEYRVQHPEDRELMEGFKLSERARLAISRIMKARDSFYLRGWHFYTTSFLGPEGRRQKAIFYGKEHFLGKSNVLIDIVEPGQLKPVERFYIPRDTGFRPGDKVEIWGDISRYFMRKVKKKN